MADPAPVDEVGGHAHVILFDLVTGLYTLAVNVRENEDYCTFLMTPQLREVGEVIVSRINQAGYLTGPPSNPNVQFGMAARGRKTGNDHDRIYGIMSIYNIQVGTAWDSDADRSEEYSFKEPKEQFAAALNRKSALLGQVFVHVEKPESGKAWQMTQTS